MAEATKATKKVEIKDLKNRHKKSDFSFMSIMQNIGKSLVFPIATLPAAALMMRMGAFISTYGDMNGDVGAQWAYWIGFLVQTPGSVVFDNLALIFGVGVAFGFAKENRGEVALVGVLAYISLIALAQNENSLSALFYSNVDLGNGMTVGTTFNSDGTIDVLGEYHSDLLYLNIPGIKGSIELENDVAISSTWLMNFGVFGGILTGLLSALIYNKFYNTQLHPALGFFSGRRFVPMVTLVAMVGVAFIMAIVWPWVNLGLIQFSIGISYIPAIGAGLYAFVNRLLIPTGLHQVLNTYFWFQAPIVTSFDGTSGVSIMYLTKTMEDFSPLLGDINAFSAMVDGTQLQFVGTTNDALSSITFVINNGKLEILDLGTWDEGKEALAIGYGTQMLLDANIGMYQAGFFPTMMFGLPAVGMAISMRAEDENKKAVWAFMISASLVAFITGVTEPLEFMFMFISPVIYVIYAALTGVYASVVVGLGISVGFGFSAGALDWVLSILSGGVGLLSSQGNWANLELFAIGMAAFVINFTVVYFIIEKLHIATPGRMGNVTGLTGNDDDGDKTASASAGSGKSKKSKKDKNAKYTKMAKDTIDFIGAENIEKVDNCITRVRLTVKDNKSYDDSIAIKIGYTGVIKVGKKAYQMIIGTQSEIIANEMTRLLAEGYGKK